MPPPDLLTPARAARAAAAALTLAIAGGLTGCSGDAAPSTATSPSVTATASPSRTGSAAADAAPRSAAEGRLAGEGYAFTLPKGWQEATKRFQDFSPLIDVGAVNAEQAGQPFRDNVNVLRNVDQDELPVEEAERTFSSELGTVASDVEVQDRTTLDGSVAVHLTGRTAAGDVTALTDQYLSYVDGAYYVITFSYGADTSLERREEEVASMLASWAWE